jgi:uncharacterized protein
LIGANGIDLVARGGVPYPVEVNPRWCASMELVERADGLSLFAAHAAACRSGELPGYDLSRLRRSHQAVGKAIVFARQDILVGDTASWLADDSVRDIPRAGSRIPAGHPVCTVFASATTTSACRMALEEKATIARTRMTSWPP